jgi:hypothetical protein
VSHFIRYLRQEDVKLDLKVHIKTVALTSQFSLPNLLQLRVFGLRSDENGNFRVGARSFSADRLGDALVCNCPTGPHQPNSSKCSRSISGSLRNSSRN